MALPIKPPKRRPSSWWAAPLAPFRILLVLSLALLLSGVILLLTACAIPCQPSARFNDTAIQTMFQRHLIAVGMVESIGVRCEWRY